MAFRVEFEPVQKVLLVRFEGRVTEELIAECYRSTPRYSTATGARAHILDFSSATELTLSSNFLHALALEPILSVGPLRHCFIIAPTAYEFGLARMFQMEGEHTRPLLEVVHTMNEALAALGIHSSHFESLGALPSIRPSVSSSNKPLGKEEHGSR